MVEIFLRTKNSYVVKSYREACSILFVSRLPAYERIPELRDLADIEDDNGFTEKDLIQRVNGVVCQLSPYDADYVFEYIRNKLEPIEHFSWLENGGDRAVIFAWMSIKRFALDDRVLSSSSSLSTLIDDIHDDFHDYSYDDSLLYSSFRENKSFASIKSMRRDIDNYIDRSKIVEGLTKKRPITSLRRLESMWCELPSAEWILKMSPQQVLWALKYLKDSDLYNRARFFLRRGSVDSQNPDYSDEIRSFIMCFIDQMCIKDRSSTDLFLIKIKSALSSKKSREKGRNLNIQISSESFSDLDELAEYYDCNKSKMIERLIKWQCEKIRKKT